MRPLTFLFKLVWFPFGLILNRPLAALWARIRAALRARSGEAGQRRRDAQRYAGLILAELTRLGFSRIEYNNNKGKRKRRKKRRVEFDYPLLMTRDELYLPIKLASIPTGIPTENLKADEVLKSLEDRLNTAVRVDYLANGKLCYVCRLGGSAFPEKFSINAHKLPIDAPALAFPLGVDSAGEHAWADLADLKHLLVAGATGGGKTTLQHVMISTLINRNTADDIEIWIIDLKGNDLTLYKHLQGTRNRAGIVRHIAREPAEAVNVLSEAYKEIRRRNDLMDKYEATSIVDLAQLTGQKMKRIVIFFDEISIMTTDTTKIDRQSIGSWGTHLLIRIAAIARSSGVHLIIGTQQVKKEVISSAILANFENRICFSCATWRESQLIISDSSAVGMPEGRAIVLQKGRTSEYQTCLITPSQVRLEVSRIAEYGPNGGLGDLHEQQRMVRDAKLLLDVACTRFAGDFGRRKLLGESDVRAVISQERFHEIAAELERKGVVEAGNNRNARRVNRVFFGRPGLLDALYGLDQSGSEDDEIAPNHTPTAEPSNILRLEDYASGLERSKALNTQEPEESPAVGGLETSGTPLPETSEPESSEEEPEIPDLFLRAFEQPTEPPSSPESPSAQPEPPSESPKPKRTRKPRTPKNTD